jgi:alpha-amylase
MCTKFWNDGDVHKYFSPFDSPYDAYMFYMNIFSDLERSVDECLDKIQKTEAIKTTNQTAIEFFMQNSESRKEMEEQTQKVSDEVYMSIKAAF